MSNKFDKGIECIGQEYSALNPTSSIDWMTTGMALAEVLIPLIQDCLERRRNNGTQLAQRVKRFGIREGAALRLALRRHPDFNGAGDMDKLVHAVKSAAHKSNLGDLRDFIESAGE
jgi:hypothetical protein